MSMPWRTWLHWTDCRPEAPLFSPYRSRFEGEPGDRSASSPWSPDLCWDRSRSRSRWVAGILDIGRVRVEFLQSFDQRQGFRSTGPRRLASDRPHVAEWRDWMEREPRW